MNATDFFDRVLPSVGLRCLATATATGAFRHAFRERNADAASLSTERDGAGDTVYFAPASYWSNKNRTAANVRAVKSIWLDLDCGPDGKPYANQEAAAKALVSFVKALKLPVPMIVSSGVGLHIYWLLNADLEPSEWREGAGLLKAACQVHGLQADHSRTTDIASVLRPVETTHRKGMPRPVRLLRDGCMTNWAAVKAALADAVPDRPEVNPAHPMVAEDLGLGPMPQHIALLADLANNADLIGPLDVGLVARAASALPPAKLVGRDYWLKTLLWPLASAALTYASQAAELGEVFLSVSSAFGAYKREGEHANGFNHAHARTQWAAALRETKARNLAGQSNLSIASLFAAAQAEGWSDDTMDAWPSSCPDDLGDHRLSEHVRPAFKRRPIHEGVAYRGEVTVLVSRGGLAKSTYATAVCLAVASGCDLVGTQPGPQTPVLMVNAEDCRGEVMLKFQAALEHHGIEVGERTGPFVFGAEDAAGLALTEVDARGREGVSASGLAQLRALILTTGAKLAVLDPLAALAPYGMNDNGLMAALMRGLKAIAQEADCGILIVAHTRKGGDADVDGAEITAGAAAITNLARAVLTVRMPSQKTLQEIAAPFAVDKSIRELVDLKANLKPLGERRFFQLASVNMRNGTPEYPEPDRVAVAEAYRPPQGGRALPMQVIRATAECLARGVATGQGTAPFSPGHQAKDRFFLGPLTSALAPHFPGLATSDIRTRAKAAFDEVQSRGWLDVRQTSIPGTGNKRSGVFVRWQATPWLADPAPGQFVA